MLDFQEQCQTVFHAFLCLSLFSSKKKMFVKQLLHSVFVMSGIIKARGKCYQPRPLAHPRRPRGSQSGREKGRDESFQERAKEPPGTYSHRAISKNSSGCRLLIGHKKCFVLLYFSWVRTRRLLSCYTCPVRSPSLCVQGKLLFSTFLTRNEGSTDESKKRLVCYQQQQFNLPREYSVFDSSQCIVNMKVGNQGRWGNLWQVTSPNM